MLKRIAIFAVVFFLGVVILLGGLALGNAIYDVIEQRERR